MSFLLDTTALSELTKPKPNTGFIRWLSSHSTDQAFIGAPSIGELEIGIALLGASKKRKDLEAWLQGLVSEFESRILPFDLSCARVWGQAIAAARRKGLSLPATDSQIAAIAIVHGLSVVTRNVRHFDLPPFGELQVVSPWS